MTGAAVTYRGGAVFDGDTLRPDHALIVEDGRIAAILPEREAPGTGDAVDVAGDILCPGFVDLQVNGGGGVLFNDDPSVDTLRRIAAAHERLGATTILPTLITDTPERTGAAIDAVRRAVADGVGAIGGLHLEGPHLGPARKGAHAASLIRAMTGDDLARLKAAAAALPALIVTLAPESTTAAQVAELAAAGAIVSLGHTDADFDTCIAWQAAGASCVTHLFNAMSQLGSRAPGLVGAALANGALSAGLIADGIHVHPAAIRVALAAKAGQGRIFLVSDAMAPAGTDLGAFVLNGRAVRRRGDRLTLADGTLAGADLDLTTAVGTLTGAVGIDLAEALRMATAYPAAVARLPSGTGRLVPGERCRVLRLAMRGGRPVLRGVPV